VFTIASARSRTNELVLSIRVPGAGRLTATASGTYKQGSRTRKVSVGTTRSTLTKAGTGTLRIKLSTASRSALRRAKRLVVAIKVTYTPTGGTAASKTRTLTLKAPKKKS